MDAWTQTFTGKVFYPLSPRTEGVCIEDIAHSLSNVCRFGGHCREFYSVAQHSVYVSLMVDDSFALWGLLHDAAEAYLGDMQKPVKDGSGLGQMFRSFEGAIERRICERFGIAPGIPTCVKTADARMLATEARQLMVWPPPQPWVELPEPLDLIIRPWLPHIAEGTFLERYRELVG